MALFSPAFALPQSPVVAVALILFALAITYALLNVFARVGVSPSPADAEAAPLETLEVESEDLPGADAGPAGSEPEEVVASSPARPKPVLKVEAVRVRGVPLALGDTASQVMRAFQPGEGERMPLIERRPDGAAARVVRAYRVGDRLVVLALTREEAADPLRLTALDVETD